MDTCQSWGESFPMDGLQKTFHHIGCWRNRYWWKTWKIRFQKLLLTQNSATWKGLKWNTILLTSLNLVFLFGFLVLEDDNLLNSGNQFDTLHLPNTISCVYNGIYSASSCRIPSIILIPLQQCLPPPPLEIQNTQSINAISPREGPVAEQH